MEIKDAIREIIACINESQKNPESYGRYEDGMDDSLCILGRTELVKYLKVDSEGNWVFNNVE